MPYKFVSDGYPEAADFDDNYVRVPQPALATAVKPAFLPLPPAAPPSLPRRRTLSLLPRFGRRLWRR
jgi:hypothetical protein